MPAFMIYTVRPGDTLGDIAVQYGTTVEAIRRLNGLRDPDRIFAGQRLRIPGEGMSLPPQRPIPPQRPVPPRPVPQRPIPPTPPMPPMPEEPEEPMPPEDNDYIVQPGDTLYFIAAREGTTVDALIRLNDIRTPNLIFPGQRLRLPDKMP